MSRKKITGQSKLSSANAPARAAEELRLVGRQASILPTSFRLSPEDKERLKRIALAVNDLSPNKKISETNIMRALIFSGEKMKPDKLLQAIREIIF